MTSRLRSAAATLAVPGSVLAGPAAAGWLGIAVPAAMVHLWTGPVRRRPLPGVVLLRDPLVSGDVAPYDGIPVTTPARTVFDCLRLLSDDDAVDLLDRALQRDWTTLAELGRRIHHHAGRHGAPKLARLVQRAAAGTHSAAGRLAARLLRHAGIRGWRAHEPIRDAHGVIAIGDLVFSAASLVIEVDGWAYHNDPEALENDRSRQRRLVAAGWTVLRFTWRDLTRRPDHVVETIIRMLDRAAILP